MAQQATVIAQENRPDNVKKDMAEKPTVIAPENRPDNVKFEKIWNRAKDCDVAAVLLHANVDGFLCMDDRHVLTADEVVECCKYGCIIEANGIYYRPVSWAVKVVDDGVVIAGVGCIDCLGHTPTPHAFLSYDIRTLGPR